MNKTLTSLAAILTSAFTVAASAQSQEPTAFSSPPADVMELARSMECPTHDGYGVSVMNMSAAGLHTMFNVRFGNADYVEDFGYRTFIDAASLANATPQLQAFIAAHECAHHTLGHTFEAYDNGFIPQDRHHQYERQADCEAIRRIAQDYGYSGRDVVSDIFDELAQVNQQIILNLPIEAEEMADMLNALPARSANRKSDGLRCPIY